MSDTASTTTTTGPDPRRWITLSVLILSVIIVVLDTTVLNVAIPSMLRDLETTIPSLEWVISGYALTLASLLIVGGRLGDLFGHRRLFVIGLILFGIGSFIAGLAPNVGLLILGEAVIEGTGAALMVPSTLALLSGSFQGRERAAAFAAWGAAMGGAAAFGPLIGGFLTTNYSWRWAFGINVVVAAVAIVGAMLFIRKSEPTGDRTAIDVLGAVLVACGTFLVVFGLSQGETYGWWRPTGALTIAGRDVWPATAPISIVPIALLAGVALIVVFYRAEAALERRDAHPLFEFSQFRHRTFRLANIATFFMAFGQLGVAISVSLFLQESRGMTPLENGLWVFPSGLAILVGAPFGGWASRRIGAVNTMRIGGSLTVVNLLLIAAALSSDLPYAGALPWFLLYGFGSGMVASQLTRVMLNDIAPSRSGAASGMNQTARQLATALGVATMGTVFAVVSAAYGLESALRPPLTVAMGTLTISLLFVWRLPRIDARPPEGSEAPGSPGVSMGLPGAVPDPIP
jgi:EmrB/QacA subfamily drug resistance transporter